RTARPTSPSWRLSMAATLRAICTTEWECRKPASSEIVARVREVERLVAEREVGNDVVEHRVLERRPVAERRIDDLHARECAVIGRDHPVPDRAAPALDQSAGIGAGAQRP